MCRKRKPSTLENMCIDALKDLYGSFLDIVIGNNRYRLNESRFKLATQLFQEHVLKSIPYMIADDVFESLKEAWKEKCSILDDIELEEAEDKVLIKQKSIENVTHVLSESIKSLLLNLKIKILEVDGDMLFTPILQSLTSMPQLTRLYIVLNIDIHVNQNSVESLIVDSLKCLPNLELFLFDECTDKILCEISKSCPLLESINISSVCALSYESIVCLANCNKLKNICFEESEYQAEAVASLISSLPNVEEVNTYNVDAVLDVIAMRGIQCDMLKEIGYHVGSNHMKTLNQHCPHIQKLSLSVCISDYPGDDFNVRNNFEFLHELSVTNLDYRDVYVLPFFQKIVNLKCLNLSEPIHMTERAFRTLAESCPQLDNLMVYGRHIVPFSLNHCCEGSIVFPQLTNLKMGGGNVPVKEILFPIRCPSLEHLEIIDLYGINAEAVEKFLELSGKSHFKKRISKNSGTETVITIYVQPPDI